MPRVVPAQIIAVIDKLFPWVRDQRENDCKTISAGSSGSVAAILDMTEELPQELINSRRRRLGGLLL
jgi:hypothetical protein